MAADKINVKGDSRVTHETATINGRRYGYLLGKPTGEQKGTLFLIHGWPDLSMGWRYQIPLFVDMGFQVVVPDMMGYGRTEAPEDLHAYSMKQAADDIKALAAHVGASRIVLGGHDWGGVVVYRVCMWHPELVTHLFVVSTPFFPPVRGDYIDLETRVKTVLPNFAYQIQLASGEPAKHVNSKNKLRHWINGMFGGKGENNEIVFHVKEGIKYDNVDKIGQSPLMTPEESDYYAEEYNRNGIWSSLNWYKMGPINHEEELNLKKESIDIPILFVLTLKDAALPPWMAGKMDEQLPNLTRKEIDTSHWALVEKPVEINAMFKDWLQATGATQAKSSL